MNAIAERWIDRCRLELLGCTPLVLVLCEAGAVQK